MNCHEVDFILDTKGIDALSANEQQAIDKHLNSCSACQGAWESFAVIAAEKIPAMRESLHARVARTLAPHLPTRIRPARRALVAGSVIVMGAAAATIALQVGDRESAIVTGTDQPAAAAQVPPSMQAIATPLAETPAADSRPSAAPALAGAAASGAPMAGTGSGVSGYALDPRSLVIVIDDASADAEARATLAECHRGVVARLSALAGLNVISGEPVSAFQESGLTNVEIARELGAGSFLTMNSRFECQVGVYDSATGAFLAGRIADFNLADDDHVVDWQFFYDQLANQVSDKVLADEATLLAEAQATFLNSALTDGERLAGLYRTMAGNSSLNRDVLNVAVIAGLSQIMTSSTDAENRRTAVQIVRGVPDPSLIDPLMYVLNYDGETEVRIAAAYALHTFFGEPNVRDALGRIVADDPTYDPAQICCQDTLTEAARRALLSDQELAKLIDAQLMNPALSDRARLQPLVNSPDGRGVGYNTPGLAHALNDKAASVVFEIGRDSDDASIRANAWSALYSASNPDPRFVPTLLEDLASHPSDSVRQSAASALTHFIDMAEVRTGFEQVLTQDTCECVRTTLTQALEASGTTL